MDPSSKKILVFSGVALAAIFLIYKLKNSQKHKPVHWQRSQEAKNREKQQRLEQWGNKTFPSDYKLTDNARQLFISYAKLLHKKLPNEEEILAKIKFAFESAVDAFPYRCIYGLAFAQPRIIDHPNYKEIMEKRDEIKKLRFIDLGCCMGTEIRQLLVEGAKKENVLGLDIQKEFIDIGIEMFGDDPSWKERFVITNVLEDDLSSQPRLTSFLAGGVDVLYCSAVYHLLCEEDTYKLTRAVAKLLPSGALYVGSTGGSKHPVDPIRALTLSQETETKEVGEHAQFLHSAETFQAMLQDNGFKNCQVQVKERGKFGHRVRDRVPQNNRGHLYWLAERK